MLPQRFFQFGRATSDAAVQGKIGETLMNDVMQVVASASVEKIKPDAKLEIATFFKEKQAHEKPQWELSLVLGGLKDRGLIEQAMFDRLTDMMSKFTGTVNRVSAENLLGVLSMFQPRDEDEEAPDQRQTNTCYEGKAANQDIVKSKYGEMDARTAEVFKLRSDLKDLRRKIACLILLQAEARRGTDPGQDLDQSIISMLLALRTEDAAVLTIKLDDAKKAIASDRSSSSSIQSAREDADEKLVLHPPEQKLSNNLSSTSHICESGRRTFQNPCEITSHASFGKGANRKRREVTNESSAEGIRRAFPVTSVSSQSQPFTVRAKVQTLEDLVESDANWEDDTRPKKRICADPFLS